MKKVMPLILLCFLVGGSLYFTLNRNNPDGEPDNLQNTFPEIKENLELEEEQSADEFQTELVEKYQKKYDDFKNSIHSDLDNLVNEAKEEYSSMSLDEQKISMYTLAYKYMNKATELEAGYDETIADMVNDMKEELENQGLSTALADDIQERYDDEKNELKEELVAKAQDVIN